MDLLYWEKPVNKFLCVFGAVSAVDWAEGCVVSSTGDSGDAGVVCDDVSGFPGV